MSTELKRQAIELFRQRFGAAPRAIGIAPGRVELLGNHTDYNGGYILAIALDRCVAVAGAPLPGGRLEIASAFFDRTVGNAIGEWRKDESEHWTHYIVGTLKELAEAGAPVGGMQLAVASTVPLGSGLSSSAALEVATAQLALALYPFAIEPMALAQLCQRAENRFVGVNCGLLDQFCAMFGRENSGLFLDCLTLEHSASPIGSDDVAVVVANSMTKHALVAGEYNKIRHDCMEAARKIGEARGKPAQLLREIAMEDFEAHKAALSDMEARRARHILTENQRVLDGLAAAARGDIQTVGRLMFGSHASSRDDLMNSCPELDALIELAREAPGAIGAKLSGGGFGGCTVNLVRKGQAEAFAAHLAEGFEKRMGQKPEIHFCAIGPGARSELL
ncbi:MAG: Galactokinase [candidate division BRC1 bacterium ADurb.BinA364]|nr:MAG: Galactokinase [candidate division BRC1 bacterium ADurb.BinA364]